MMSLFTLMARNLFYLDNSHHLQTGLGYCYHRNYKYFRPVSCKSRDNFLAPGINNTLVFSDASHLRL